MMTNETKAWLARGAQYVESRSRWPMASPQEHYNMALAAGRLSTGHQDKLAEIESHRDEAIQVIAAALGLNG